MLLDFHIQQTIGASVALLSHPMLLNERNSLHFFPMLLLLLGLLPSDCNPFLRHRNSELRNLHERWIARYRYSLRSTAAQQHSTISPLYFPGIRFKFLYHKQVLSVWCCYSASNVCAMVYNFVIGCRCCFVFVVSFDLRFMSYKTFGNVSRHETSMNTGRFNWRVFLAVACVACFCGRISPIPNDSTIFVRMCMEGSLKWKDLRIKAIGIELSGEIAMNKDW